MKVVMNKNGSKRTPGPGARLSARESARPNVIEAVEVTL